VLAYRAHPELQLHINPSPTDRSASVLDLAACRRPVRRPLCPGGAALLPCRTEAPPARRGSSARRKHTQLPRESRTPSQAGQWPSMLDAAHVAC
jgi:hypothetical protein